VSEQLRRHHRPLPVFDRLFGSKVAVFNAEVRIPLFGSPMFGLVNFPYLPLEVSPFFDAGVAWTGDQKPDLRIVSGDNTVPASCANAAPTAQLVSVPCATRIPVMSAGVTFRMNVLGYMISRRMSRIRSNGTTRVGGWNTDGSRL